MHLSDCQKTAGAVWGDTTVGYVPVHYGDSGSEYEAVKTGVGMVDFSLRGKLQLTGKDRTRFLHGMITNTVEGLPEMAGNHAAITTVQGQTLLDLWVHHLGDCLWLETEPGYQAQLYETLDRFLIADDVTMTDETDAWAVLGVLGQNALGAVQTVLGCNVADLAEHHTVVGQWSGQPFWITRRGGMGFDVRIEVGQGAALWQSLHDFGAVPVGFQTQEVLRVEAGIPRCGLEIGGADTPLEVGLADTVNFDKGCYIGQEVIAKMHFRGKPRRYLVGVLVDGEAPLAHGTEITVGEKAVGRITSSVKSTALDRVIALAIVRRGVHEVGQVVDMGNCEGKIVALPFAAPLG